MLELLFIIIIVSIIISRRVRQAKESNDRYTQSPSLPPESQNGAPVVTSAPPRRTNPPLNRQSGPSKIPQKTLAKSAIEEAKEDGHSTTAYLMEKAEADAKEHAKEKFEEQKRLYETRGGLPVAERHFEGDPLPQGRQCVKCGYCGAENLLPMTPRTRYSCYFCREAL